MQGTSRLHGTTSSGKTTSSRTITFSGTTTSSGATTTKWTSNRKSKARREPDESNRVYGATNEIKLYKIRVQHDSEHENDGSVHQSTG